MHFDDFQYLFPPRPNKSIPQGLLGFYEQRGYIAQAKKNGACSVIAISPDKKITAMNRHREAHKAWTANPETMTLFTDLPGDGWYVFVAELLHAKVAGIKDTNYINDVLVVDGKYLVGTNFVERQAMLQTMFLTGDETETDSHFVLNKTTWLARNHSSGFDALFTSLDKPEDEGLVLKSPKVPLAPCFREGSNEGWQVKCRRQTKNFGF